jgi:hypothetical protein
MRTIKYILSVVVLSSIMLVSLSTYASVIVIGTIETKKASEKFTLKKILHSNSLFIQNGD